MLHIQAGDSLVENGNARRQAQLLAEVVFVLFEKTAFLDWVSIDVYPRGIGNQRIEVGSPDSGGCRNSRPECGFGNFGLGFGRFYSGFRSLNLRLIFKGLSDDVFCGV
ncbi:hypothetical protein SDC9_175914 [bioreactor metagenome]|uniref:Uncharacterized protein n=1 Tax=bioreactor metagenome TaxID=1076179 RepID=A0A645GRA9_9ZZZZ